MDSKSTALVLIGYQNDYFAEDGVLHAVIEESTKTVLANTLAMIEALIDTDVLIVTTPIVFTPDYSELVDPIGILKIIKEAGAFRSRSTGVKTIPEILGFGDRIVEVPGKRGFDAFADTGLDNILNAHKITDIAFAGAVTSICIDSTGRAAFEKGYKVTQLSDCTSSRTTVEQAFYCSTVFPLYGAVMDSKEFIQDLVIEAS